MPCRRIGRGGPARRIQDYPAGQDGRIGARFNVNRARAGHLFHGLADSPAAARWWSFSVITASKSMAGQWRRVIAKRLRGRVVARSAMTALRLSSLVRFRTASVRRAVVWLLLTRVNGRRKPNAARQLLLDKLKPRPRQPKRPRSERQDLCWYQWVCDISASVWFRAKC
jgi:hypothetical protein